LQSQLTDVDVPKLVALFDDPPRVARLKGKANYLCPRRLRLHLAEGSRRGGPPSEAEHRLAAWAEATPTGDLAGLDFGAGTGGAALRARVCADATACAGPVCRPGGDCPWRRARREAAEAELVVVNHALLAAGLAGNGVLPSFRCLIADEAHHL